MGEMTEYIEAYMLHDPIGNMEAVIAEYDTEKLKSAEQNGAVFIAVYNTGRREIVKAEDVSEPVPRQNGIRLVQPKYVDDRTRATVAVFDALGAIISPSAETAAENGVSAAAVKSPEETFEEALSALRLLAYPEEGGADAEA